MKQLLLWFLLRRWAIVLHTKGWQLASRRNLLSKLTENGMIPATGVIAADAAMILLFDDDKPKFDRHEFMTGWRTAKSIIMGASDKPASADMLRHYSGVAEARGWETSYVMGARLAVEQFDNLMASRRQ